MKDIGRQGISHMGEEGGDFSPLYAIRTDGWRIGIYHGGMASFNLQLRKAARGGEG
jgi:hypothetical protein